jgi:glycosyltransferase involved in cell wall biosynthesis
MDSGGLVSIVICAFNAGRYLEPSIRSAVAQTYAAIEVVVIDDGSADGSVDAAKRVVKDPRVLWLRQENLGKPAALNHALRELRGEFYALQDADDLSSPCRIETLVGCMRENPDVASVYSGHELIIGDQRVAPTFRPKGRTACRADIDAMRMPGHDPTGMYRMSMVGGIRYSEDLPVVEGYDYTLRVGERWPMLVVGECLYSYRSHDASITRSDPGRRTRLVEEVRRRAFERRGLPFEAVPPGWAGSNGHVHDDNNLAAQFIESVLDQRDAGRRVSAVLTGLQCSLLHVMDPHYHKALAYAIMPRQIVGWVRQRRVRHHG